MSDENSNYDAPISGVAVIPSEEALTGTITSDGTTVTGVGTSILADINRDDWIWDSNQKEVRQVRDVSNRLEVLYLKKPFTANIAAPIALEVVRDSELEELSLLIDVGQPDGELEGQVLKSGTPVSFKKESPTRGRKGFISPKVVDGTNTIIRVITIK